MRQLLRTPKEHYLMIIRCHHLREAGIMKHDCCSHCHLLAGCVVYEIPNRHRAIFCCARTHSFAPEEVEAIAAKIPEWEKQEDHLYAPSPFSTLPSAFRPAYQAIQRLEQDERYLAALLFGPIPIGEPTGPSELEVQIIVHKDAACHNRSYLMLEGTRLNLLFLSLEQFQERVRCEIAQLNRLHNRVRPLAIAKSVVVFDKTGRVRPMQEEAQHEQPPALSPRIQQYLQGLFSYYRTRIEHAMKYDPSSALYVMYDGLVGLIQFHYQLHRRWMVVNRHAYNDLRHWDRDLAQLVEQFLTASGVNEKFQHWLAISDSVLQPLGDFPPASSNICSCDTCRDHLAMLLEK